MRIFQVLSSRATGGVGLSRIWLHNLYEPLLDLGHDVHLFSSDSIKNIQKKRLARQRKTTFSNLLLETFSKEHRRRPFNLFFSYLTDDMIEPSVIDEIRRCGVPTCNFSCNNTHQFYLVKGLSCHFDYNLHSEKFAADIFRKIGATPIWFPMGANPKYYKTYNSPKARQVSFVGQNYATRTQYIWHLLESGVDTHVYGPGWVLKRDYPRLREFLRWARRTREALGALVAVSVVRRAYRSASLAHLDLTERLRQKYRANLHGPISDEQMIEKYSDSQISLGFLDVFDFHDPSSTVKQHLHLREFEAPMSGAFYVTGYCEELTEFYEPDKEIITYRNVHELLHKVKYYLSHPEEAERIRLAGQQRALQCHTYQRRFKELFPKIGLM